MAANSYPDADLQAQIRACIKGFLMSKGLTEVELGARMGLKEQTVRNYLSGTRLSTDTIRKFADVLSYPYELLLKGEPYVEETSLEMLERRVSSLEARFTRLESLFDTIGRSLLNKGPAPNGEGPSADGNAGPAR